MFKQSDILDYKKSKILRQKSKEVTFPLNEEDKELINNMIMYLRISQDEEYAKKNDIRAGMGLSAVQLGILKRYFVISYKNDDGTFLEYKVVNPKIVSHSEEEIYVEEGEGCLSVNEYVEGIVRVREEIAVAFQHEIDHLNGIIFTDKIDKKDPYKNKDNMRSI